MQETPVYSWVRKICWRRDRQPTPVFLGFPCGSASKESTCNVGDLGSIPGLGKFPGKGKSYPLQYSGLENSLDCVVHEVAKSQTWLSDSVSLSSASIVILLLLWFANTNEINRISTFQLVKENPYYTRFNLYHATSVQFSSFQSLSRVWLIVNPWTAAL